MIRNVISFQAKLFLALGLVTFLAALLPSLLFSNQFSDERLEMVKKHALLYSRLVGTALAGAVAPGETAQVQSILDMARANNLRITVTDAAGRVIMDSSLPDEQLPGVDNHADRPEIESAILTGEGISLRHSNSLGSDSIYAATRLPDNRIVRVAVPFAIVQNAFESQLSSLIWTVSWVILLCLLLSIFLTSRIRRKISAMTSVVQSISLGNYQSRLHIVPGNEFLPLADAVNRMAENIDSRINSSANEQAQLKTILNSLHEGVLVVDQQGNVLRCNRSLAEMFPDTAAGRGKQAIECIPLPGLQEMLETAIAPQAEDKRRNAMRREFELPDGRTIIAHVSSPVQSEESDAGTGAVAVLYDASKLMRLERIRRDFISNISHELRTPLTAIGSSAEILMEAAEIPDEFKKFPKVIHRHATALSRLISDLLELSRLENSREDFATEQIELHTPLNEALASVNAQLAEKQLSLDLSEWSGAQICGKSSLLSRVFANLLENAARYAPQGSSLKVFNFREQGKIITGIADRGPGIPEAELERIFERFYQVEKGRAGTGTGIGLAISKHIIERHNGRIWAESPWQGFATAFFFSLPLKEEQ